MTSTAPKERIHAIDTFRGFALFIMVLFNYAARIQSLPVWMKHSTDIGMTFPDLGTPVFIFAIGLTYGLSFRRRMQKDGLSSTIGHFVRRYFAILGMGAIVSAGETLFGFNTTGRDWGVLQTIGAAGLLTMLVILLPTWLRLLVGLGLMAGYQLLLDSFWLDLVRGSPHNGLLGSLGWTAILILATVFADLYHRESTRRFFPFVSLLFLVAGFALALVVPVSKPRLSASYELITLGFSGVIFALFYLTKFKLNYFAAWGQNPILLFALSYLGIGLFVLPGIPVWHEQASLWLAGLQVSLLLLFMGLLAVYWQKRGFIFSI